MDLTKSVLIARPAAAAHIALMGVLTLGATLLSVQNAHSAEPTDFKPVDYTREEPHPLMLINGTNSMHNDAYNSDVHEDAGPVTQNTKLQKFKYSGIVGLCPTFSFLTLSSGEQALITVCVKALQTTLYLMEPSTFKTIAKYALPKRQGVVLAGVTFQFEQMLKDTSGGAYFYINNKKEIVVPTADRTILTIALDESQKTTSFKLKQKIKLAASEGGVIPDAHCASLKDPDFQDPRCDKLTAVLPDFEGRLWFASRYGVIGVIEPQTLKIYSTKIPEQIQNSMAMSREGLYLVSDAATYNFRWNENGSIYDKIKTVWRAPYDRGHRVKPGQLNQGSGTTPTLFGGKYVSVGDNADPHMNVLVYERKTGELLCKVPVFQEGKSAVENSFIGIGKTLIASNTYGYTSALSKNHPTPGMTRIDVFDEPQEDGSYCKKIWHTEEFTPMTATPKFSLGSKMIYFYGKDPKVKLKKEQWYVGGVDIETGKLVYRKDTGKGLEYDNFWGTISPGPDHSVYFGTTHGMMRLSDQ